MVFANIPYGHVIILSYNGCLKQNINKAYNTVLAGNIVHDWPSNIRQQHHVNHNYLIFLFIYKRFCCLLIQYDTQRERIYATN